jgi:putative ABC transport system permease protein
MSNITSALSSLWGNKTRSVLTLLGIIIGVSSVTTLVSLGQGLKNDVSHLIQGFGTNVIVVIGGKIDTSSSSSTNPANFISGDVLTMKDVDAIQKQSGVEAVTPMSIVPGSLKYNNTLSQPTLVGVYPNALNSLQVLSIDQGKMFQSNDEKVIILSSTAKQDLFGSTSALGKSVSVGGESLEVIGVLGKPTSSSIFGSEFDTLSLIPFNEATVLTKNQIKIMRIIVKANDKADVTVIKKQLHSTILGLHHNEDDFSVLTQDDLLGLFNQFLSLATSLVSAIAAISLVVGGIGIMNIMLVTVTERTREIGLRKALGATRVDILGQFMTEAILLTLIGGIIGLGIAFGIGQIVRLNTPLQPAITLNVVLLAVGISTIVGVVFGLWPAIRAANKAPIEALRYE